MDQSGLRTFMDAKARAEWNRDLRELETIPEFTKQNVDATFFNVHMQRQDFFERGVIECFRNLSWDHKTNSPFKFGKRIIINGLYRLWGTGKNKWLSWNDDKGNHLDDLIRVFSILDGKPEPDHRQNLRTLIDAADTKKERAIEHKYFALKWYLKGTAHLTFKRLDLVERMNNILAKQYPRALPDASI
jgi:hypothetical protein